MAMTIPRRHRRAAGEEMHPSTISPLTESVGIAVGSGAATIFNATPSSTYCSAIGGATSCRFPMVVPAGTITITVSTYPLAGGGGTMLDRGTATVNIVAGQANSATVTLGPVVTTTNDSGPGSLRYAVATANQGDTIVFFLAAGAKIGLSSPITLARNVTIAGPGASSVTIDGGGATQLFVVRSVATIAGLSLEHGSAKLALDPGGAISNTGVLTLSADSITSNTSLAQSPLIVRRAPRHEGGRMGKHLHPHCTFTYFDGGAVWNDGTLTVTSSTFSGNTVSSAQASCQLGRGGAIFNAKNGVLAVNGSTLTNNAAYDGGAIYNDGANGQASFDTDTFSANLGCTAATGCPYGGGNYATGYGGAIYDASGPGITVTNSTFNANVTGGNSPESYGEGSGLDLQTGDPVLTNSAFTNNVAGGGSSNCSNGEGAAIFAASLTLEIDNDTFSGNLGGGDSEGFGAIYSYAQTRGTGDTFTNNVTSATGSACTSTGIAYGGAYYVGSSGSLTLSNSTFSNNTATSSYESFGGAIDEYGGPVKLSNVTFTSNAAIATGAFGAGSDDAYGGAIYEGIGDALTLSHTTFTSNSATAQSSASSGAYGGAIDAQNTILSTADSFVSNTAVSTGGTFPTVYGGAIDGYGVLTLTNDTFSKNSASGPYKTYGGAVYNDAVSTFTNVAFTQNSAVGTIEGDGGAIDDQTGFTLNGGTFSQNSASTKGGAIYASGDVIANAILSGNAVTASQAYGGGGGVFIGGFASTIVYSTISGNTVTMTGPSSGGGGIYNDGGLSMVGSTLSGNSVTGTQSTSGGGGMYSHDSAAVTNSTFANNTSADYGGGVDSYPTTYTQTFTNATFLQNSATVAGGNIDNDTNNTVVLTNSIVAGGSSSAGPDVFNSGTLTSGGYNIIQTAVTFSGGVTTGNVTKNPMLSPLANNGGPSPTAADAGSPAAGMIPFTINNGSISPTCGIFNGTIGLIVQDQRGYLRGTSNVCDAGAYELAGTPSAARPRIPVVHGGHHRLKPRSHRQ
jgi:predicted outer membrane repeat protein